DQNKEATPVPSFQTARQHCLEARLAAAALRHQNPLGHFAAGLFCLGMGIVLILSAKSIKEIEINYTKIHVNCAKLRENAINFDKECTCSIPFYLPETIQGSVYMYYKLYGCHQNLYRYILSRSNSQLVGTDIKDVGNCTPFRKSQNETPIAPCGAIANSIFNDTIILSYNLNSSIHIKVPMLRSGITWRTDKYVKFQNPSSINLSRAFAGYILRNHEAPSWPKPVYELDEEDSGNNGFINDDFIVWMRTAAFPTFKKLYRRLNQIQQFIKGLPSGKSILDHRARAQGAVRPVHVRGATSSAPKRLRSSLSVTKFKGEKSVVLSTLIWSGGNSLFFGLTYTVTGAVTWLASFSMMAVHLLLKERKVFVQQ
ncbi:hypothetical protein MC885_016881, partial [Smutsia gigantea]